MGEKESSADNRCTTRGSGWLLPCTQGTEMRRQREGQDPHTPDAHHTCWLAHKGACCLLFTPTCTQMATPGDQLAVEMQGDVQASRTCNVVLP